MEKLETKVGDATLTLETGKLAQLASGSVTVRLGDTVLLAPVGDTLAISVAGLTSLRLVRPPVVRQGGVIEYLGKSPAIVLLLLVRPALAPLEDVAAEQKSMTCLIDLDGGVGHRPAR